MMYSVNDIYSTVDDRMYFYSKPAAFRKRTQREEPTQHSPACFHRSGVRLASHLGALHGPMGERPKQSAASLQDIDSHPHFALIPASSVPAIAQKSNL